MKAVREAENEMTDYGGIEVQEFAGFNQAV